jgi:hypothetical protein
MRHARALVARTKRNSVSIRVGASARRGFQEKIRGLRDRAKLDTGTTELGSARATLEGYCIGGKRDDCGGGHQYQRKGSVWRRWGTNRDTRAYEARSARSQRAAVEHPLERSSGWASSRQWATHPVGTTVTVMRRPQWGQKRGGSSARPQPGQSVVIRPQPVQWVWVSGAVM